MFNPEDPAEARRERIEEKEQEDRFFSHPAKIGRCFFGPGMKLLVIDQVKLTEDPDVRHCRSGSRWFALTPEHVILTPTETHDDELSF